MSFGESLIGYLEIYRSQMLDVGELCALYDKQWAQKIIDKMLSILKKTRRTRNDFACRIMYTRFLASDENSGKTGKIEYISKETTCHNSPSNMNLTMHSFIGCLQQNIGYGRQLHENNKPLAIGIQI